MITPGSDFLRTVPNLLTGEECRKLIERAEGLGFEAATVSTPSGPKMLGTIRNNDRVTTDDPELAAWLWERTRDHVPPTIDSAVAVGLNERMRFYRYDASQRFHGHRDGTVERSELERSRLTFMVYLNADARGGQTVFYSEDRVDGLRRVVDTIEPQTGMALIFAHEWWHEGAKVLSGRKYVLRSDVFYRRGENVQ